MKVYDSLVTTMDEGRIAELLDWNHAEYDQLTGIVVVPLYNDASDEYYKIIQAMTEHFEIDPDKISKADISLSISTVSGAFHFIIDVGMTCKEFGCADMTDDELSMIGVQMNRFINAQSRKRRNGKMADIIQMPKQRED